MEAAGLRDLLADCVVEDGGMSECTMTRDAYEKCIAENIEAVKQSNMSKLEAEHTIRVLRCSVQHYYKTEFDWSSKTDEEIVAAGLQLAREFYKAHGYEVPEGYKFYDARHPQEQGMWNLAVIAFELLTGTDLNDALANIGE